MTLAKVVERLLKQENNWSGLLQKCFISLMEASVSLKEAMGEEEDDDEESGDDQDAVDEDTEDDDDDEVWLFYFCAGRGCLFSFEIKI